MEYFEEFDKFSNHGREISSDMKKEGEMEFE
jgi:hypothetical protein